MTVKIIGVLFTLICLFTYAFGGLSIKKADLAKFKGSDPTAHCGSTQDMTAECNKLGSALGVNHGKTKQIKGFPRCDSSDSVKLADGEGTVKVLGCAWEEGKYMFVGKGKTPGHYMSYLTDNSGTLCPNMELKYPGN